MELHALQAFFPFVVFCKTWYPQNMIDFLSILRLSLKKVIAERCDSILVVWM